MHAPYRPLRNGMRSTVDICIYDVPWCCFHFQLFLVEKAGRRILFMAGLLVQPLCSSRRPYTQGWGSNF
ncbi:hypothetical protein L345_03739, partial [Ophiophagus hannah]